MARRTASIRFPVDLLDKLDAVAAESDMSRNAVVTQACRQYVAAEQKRTT